MEDVEITILRFVREQSGLDAPGDYQFEDLYIDTDEEHPGGNRTIRFRYVFDEDGFSQYDKTTSFEGFVTLDVDSHILTSNLKVTDIGVAAHYKPPAGLMD